MKFKTPGFMEGVKTPIEGEIAIRKFATNPGAFDSTGTCDLFAKTTPRENVIVVGIDEVGRGPLAGPVVACAAVLKAPDIMPELNDSKKLTRPKREAMFDAVKEACACYAIASASVEEIDEMNILEADFLAMRRALTALGMKGLEAPAPEMPVEVKGSFACQNILIAVDGNLKIHGVPDEMQIPIIKGDGLVASISAASILAKVFRDRYMDKLGETYPGYGFEKNAGYGTKIHLDGIRKQGFCPAHRKSFHPKSL
ncbi:MAG: ribonuclease HII [Fibrobacter sp.]|nr:ribonuclease HII [Fibrobacter sp.]